MPEMLAGTLLFDLDGTLVDSAGDLAGSLDTLMAEKDLPPIGIVEGRKLIGHGIANLVRGALKLHGASIKDHDLTRDIERFTEIYSSRLTELTRTYAGVPETLNLLQSQGWQMGICTNKREKFARAIVNELGMDKYFKFVSGPDTFGVSKPDPLQLTKTSDAVDGGSPILFVGDSEVDVATAKAAGFPFIGLSYGYSKIPLASLAPDALLDDFRDIPAAVKTVVHGKL